MRLIDRVLPYPDFALRHSVVIDTPAHMVREAIGWAKASDDALVRWLAGLWRVLSRGLRAISSRNEALDFDAFTPLVRGPYELAYGIVGRFWRAVPDIAPINDVASFERFSAGGFAKLVLTFEMRVLSAERTKLLSFTHLRCDDTGL